MPAVLSIPEALADKYQGCGYALAAVSLDGMTLVDFSYCRDIDSDFEDEEGNSNLSLLLQNPKFKAYGEFFEIHGQTRMAFGMLSGHEFVEL